MKQRRKLPGYAERAYWNRVVHDGNIELGGLWRSRYYLACELLVRLRERNYPRRK